ncbi:hypothetical protein ACE01N_10120 [Saccharicrinis sp. FJH2]|uniref:hypothetical protein n=1 Tax=Saccharicrinis sp. FJH65 TaxID=3344659 RepID=UPI0035F47037
MTYKPIPTKKFKKFLKKRGLKHIRDNGDHEIWDFPNDKQLLRPVTIIGCEKEIPPLHIKTNLLNMGIEYDDFLNELN